MNLYPVYPLFDIEIVKGLGCHVWDSHGQEYLDLYGGHAVISIGHSHPHYVEALQQQVARLGFYSNSVVNGLQEQLARRLGSASGYEDYSLFLVNSGAEANENALKLASFHTGRKRILAVEKAFHGRTSLAVEATDNPRIVAPVNAGGTSPSCRSTICLPSRPSSARAMWQPSSWNVSKAWAASAWPRLSSCKACARLATPPVRC